jgi:hypothetical protein
MYVTIRTHYSCTRLYPPLIFGLGSRKGVIFTLNSVYTISCTRSHFCSRSSHTISCTMSYFCSRSSHTISCTRSYFCSRLYTISCTMRRMLKVVYNKLHDESLAQRHKVPLSFKRAFVCPNEHIYACLCLVGTKNYPSSKKFPSALEQIMTRSERFPSAVIKSPTDCPTSCSLSNRGRSSSSPDNIPWVLPFGSLSYNACIQERAICYSTL